MALLDDLKAEVAKTFQEKWEVTAGRVVPAPSSVGLGNKAIEFETATVLYADLDGSTAMVDKTKWQFSAEVYKTYLHCAAKIVKSQNGVITAYDGDRIMALFIGDRKSSCAAMAALQLNYVVRHVINPAIKARYTTEFAVRHTVGIDMSAIRAARTGVRGDNDLVWVGRAANYAAKMTSLPSTDFQIWITDDVYKVLASDVKQHNGQDIWSARRWTAMNNLAVFGSSWAFPT